MIGLVDNRRDGMIGDQPMYSSPPQSSSSSIAQSSFNHGHFNNPSFDGTFSFDGSSHSHPTGDHNFTTSLGPFNTSERDVYPRYASAGSPTTGMVGSAFSNPSDSYFDDRDERRPSVASVNTNASSTGSRASISRRMTGKLHDFFGDSGGEHHHHRHHPHLPHIHTSSSNNQLVNPNDSIQNAFRQPPGPTTPLNGPRAPTIKNPTGNPNMDVTPFMFPDSTQVPHSSTYLFDNG